jgi:dTDP-4-amino-4,6-dideoxygalactose transaminase
MPLRYGLDSAKETRNRYLLCGLRRPVSAATFPALRPPPGRADTSGNTPRFVEEDPLSTIPVMRPWLGAEEAEAAAETIRSGWVAQGPRVAEFETAVAGRVGAEHGVALSSCTTALYLALVVLGIGPGDEVVVPSLSFIATANAVRYVGATPVFADVDLATGNLNAKTVEQVIGPATRAAIVVHQGGVPAPVGELRTLAESFGIALVEDAACALGSTVDGVPVGQGAELAAFSFHPRKVITTGEGGMLTTDNADWAARARRLREHGMNVSAADRHQAGKLVLEQYLETGYNYRMTDVQAAIGLVQLTRLDAMVARRRELARRYQELLRDVPGLQTVGDPPWGTTNYQSFWVLLPDDFPVSRNELLERLLAAGVSARRGIMASHLEPAYAYSPARGNAPGAGSGGTWRSAELPETERLTGRSLILPLFHDLAQADQDRVVEVVREAAR